jgi:general secretion pathway protein M
MKDWFASLQQREQWILIGGGIAAAVIVLWLVVLSPMRNESDSLRLSVASKQRLLVDLVRLEATQAPGGAAAVQGAGQTLVIIIDSTAQAHGLTLPRTRPNGPNGIDVTFQAAAFDSLVQWLIALQTTYAVQVESASFSSAREPGLVNGQLSLRRI